MNIEPFRIAIDDHALIDLQDRLSRTRWQTTLPASGWREGIDADFLQRLVAYWRDQFDWRTQEARLNKLPQFIAEVDDHRIHFVHQRGIGPNPLPLVITHGWPGSFVEMEAIIPLLTDPGRYGGDPSDAFDLVVPSLPGYAFSSAPAVSGTGPFQVAVLWAKLMAGLGYAQYGAQGGDWGASVSTWLAYQHPDRVKGLHLNFIPGSFKPPIGAEALALTAEEEAFIKSAGAWSDAEGAYARIQATKPQTLAFGLNDSPVGLASWISEKVYAWSDHEGAEVGIDFDDLLTNISLYWFTGTVGSSFRMYRESQHRPLHFQLGQRVIPPLGVAEFPRELLMPPRSWVERVFDVRCWTKMHRGGHFAAMEAPEDLAREVQNFSGR